MKKISNTDAELEKKRYLYKKIVYYFHIYISISFHLLLKTNAN